MTGMGRGNSAATSRMAAPQEVYSRSASEAASATNPLETFAPGVMTHDGAFADPQGWTEPSFEEEAAALNMGRGFSEPARSLDARQQFGTLFEAPSVAAEQTGVFTRNAQREKSHTPKSGMVFDGFEHSRQRKLHELREENHLPQHHEAPPAIAATTEEKSTTRQSAEQYEAHDLARIEQLRLSIKQTRRSKKLSPSSGALQLESRAIKEKNSATFQLIESVQRFVFGEARRKSALEMYQARSAKKVAHKGPGLDMGGQERRGDAVGEMMSKVEREAGHELDLQAD